MLVQIRVVRKQTYNILGYKKTFWKLKDRGIPCTEKRVQRLMRENNLKSRIRRKYKPQMTKAAREALAFPNLLNQNFETTKPNQVWVADITYIREGNHWSYLAVVLDLFKREPVGWAYGRSPDAQLCCAALKAAIQKRHPPRGLILHSDRGSQYTSKAYKDLFTRFGFVGSMSRTGNPYDNAVMESFFKSLKTEWVNHYRYPNARQAYESLYYYIEVFYKYQRPHGSLGYKTPCGCEKRSIPAV